MAEIVPSELTAKNGEAVKIRTALPGDAANTLGLTLHAIETSDFLTYSPGELTRTRREEKRLIKRMFEDPGNIMFVAEVGDDIVALLNTARSKRARLEHNVEFGLVVHQDWRGQGLGAAMVKTLINWARKDGSLERVELRVTEGNEPGIALYTKLGFEEEGRRHLAVRQKDGGLADDILMALFLRRHPRMEA